MPQRHGHDTEASKLGAVSVETEICCEQLLEM